MSSPFLFPFPSPLFHSLFNLHLYHQNHIPASFFNPSTKISRTKSIATHRFAKQYPNIRFYKIDIDEVPDLAQELNIRSMPTFILYNNGEEKEKVVGANPMALEAAIKTVA